MKAATAAGKLILMHDGISIHAAREGGDVTLLTAATLSLISIHAAREGGDTEKAFLVSFLKYFNPRRP